jgi:hypothetical protein
VYIAAYDFDQLIEPLGKTQIAGRAAALAVFDALADMVQRCDSSIEELTFRREAYDLTIALRTDEVGANEENIESVCAALAQASAIHIHGHDEDTFWLEIKVPGVFETDAFDPLKAVSSYVGEKRAPVDADTPPPEWLVDAMRAATEDRERLSREDFLVEHPQMDKYLDLFNAFRHVADGIAAEFVYTPPKLPTKEHGSCYIIAKELTLQGADIEALFACIAQASSFGVSYCADDRVRVGAEISCIYICKE